MRIWVRRFAVTLIVTVLAAAAAWVLLMEAFLSSFMPNVLLQLLLPVGLTLLCVAGWRLILALYRWAPKLKIAPENVG